MVLYLIRHGKTAGNLERRYVGATDEPLCPQGIAELKKREYPPVGCVVTSPMKRCLQTAQILYGADIPLLVCEGLKEMDFGTFEYHNYEELKTDPAYQAWIDSQGEKAMPGGEDRRTFSKRCVRAFEEQVEILVKRNGWGESAAFVVHGGTIMAVMERFGIPRRAYYDWQIPNGQGLLLTLQPEKWTEGKKELTLIGQVI